MGYLDHDWYAVRFVEPQALVRGRNERLVKLKTTSGAAEAARHYRRCARACGRSTVADSRGLASMP